MKKRYIIALVLVIIVFFALAELHDPRSVYFAPGQSLPEFVTSYLSPLLMGLLVVLALILLIRIMMGGK